MDPILCLYFDDELFDPDDPLGDTVYELERYFGITFTKVDTVEDAEKALRLSGYRLLFLDIRILPEKGGGTGPGRPWHRTGIGILERIRNGDYFVDGSGTPHDIPIIVITAVADTDAQDEILRIGRGRNNEFKLALFEKPADADDIGRAATAFFGQARGEAQPDIRS